MRSLGIIFSAIIVTTGLIFGSSDISRAEENYPARPVTIVVPFAAGGSSDVIARLLAEQLSTDPGGNFVVENKPGAGTLIGTLDVKDARPDGYRLLLVDLPFTVNPSVISEADYDPVRDFTPIIMIGASAQFLYARPGRFDDVKALLDEAKTEPEAITVAHAGVGTTTHLMTLMLEKEIGATFLKVPYQGSAPALADTAAGHTDIAFSSFASAASLVGAGQLKVLATTTEQRLPSFPDVATLAELGAESLVIEHWWGLVGPSGIPSTIVDKLGAGVKRALDSSEVRERLAKLHVEPRGGSGKEFEEIIRTYAERWKKVADEHGVRK